MQGFYNITTAVKNQLLQDDFCNTVTIGDIFNVDLKKQTIFPLSHIIVNSADLENNVWRFNMSVISMDIVDKSKELETDVFIGNDNEHDVLNTQLAVLNRLLEVLRRGSLSREYYQLDGNPSLEPFTERFENYLAGWTATFDVLIPNTMTACDGLTTIVACADATYSLTDSDLNILYSGSISSGGTLNQPIQDSTVSITDDIGNVLHSVTVLAEGSATQAISDSTVVIKDDSNNTLHTVSVNAEGTANQIIADSTVNINNSAATLLHSVSVNAEGTASQTISDSTVTIKDDSNNTLYTLSVVAEGSANQIISDSTAVLKTTGGATISTTSINAQASANITAPDTALEVNGTPEGSVVAGSTVDVQLSDSGGTVTPTSVTQVGNDLQIVLPDPPVAVTRSTATLIKTGQTTSYRTGDDGDLEAGRATSFLVLDSAPLHNDGTATLNATTNRFTDELGGQTYANNIVLDWSTWNGSTLLGYAKTSAYGNANNWNTSIDTALAHTAGSFTTGWRLPNTREMYNIMNMESATGGLNYAPFSISTNINLDTSTTQIIATTQRQQVNNQLRNILNKLKTTADGAILPVRTFSLSLLNVLS